MLMALEEDILSVNINWPYRVNLIFIDVRYVLFKLKLGVNDFTNLVQTAGMSGIENKHNWEVCSGQ